MLRYQQKIHKWEIKLVNKQRWKFLQVKFKLYKDQYMSKSLGFVYSDLFSFENYTYSHLKRDI